MNTGDKNEHECDSSTVPSELEISKVVTDRVISNNFLVSNVEEAVNEIYKKVNLDEIKLTRDDKFKLIRASEVLKMLCS